MQNFLYLHTQPDYKVTENIAACIFLFTYVFLNLKKERIVVLYRLAEIKEKINNNNYKVPAIAILRACFLRFQLSFVCSTQYEKLQEGKKYIHINAFLTLFFLCTYVEAYVLEYTQNCF